MSIRPRNPDLEATFPNLSATGYAVTSEPADAPNCIGWALYDMHHFWDPGAMGFTGYYWPPGIQRDDSIDAWTAVFALHGYRECETADLEPGFEKIAIYAGRHDEPAHEAQHVARQVRSGVWTSKLGPGEDIEHQSLDGLSGTNYGRPVKFMKREMIEVES